MGISNSLRVCQGIKGISKKFEGCFKKVSRWKASKKLKLGHLGEGSEGGARVQPVSGIFLLF